ncbi:tripartite tricarboxylate transporter TctB family protein [Halococcus hamelinensis]|uniref:DUF1468 domain-containing protein n=1 Tax=Halococcus hamelinensis 100A6 TaxID=1132509 RepID=M0LWP8_9EURY|nr:tripartite tricarboxylate transporter TctB family protein [Halococcus hamelinensis]EMA37578.1 hypothetical protein C447_12692 [Halococcus hamelinensis 100A6]
MNISDSDKPSFSLLDREVVVDPGEAILPVVVLIGCGIYYGGTRSLPSQSMVYAGPLLYGTAALAVITFAQHSLTIGQKTGEATPPTQTSEGQTVTSATDAAEATAESGTGTEPESNNKYFNRYTAAGLVVLSAGYVFSLEILGFIFPTVGFLAALVTLFGERRPIYITTYSVALTAVTWAIFIYWLNIPL